MLSTKQEKKELRQFAILFSIFLAGIVGTLIPYMWDLTFNLTIYYISLGIASIGLLFPSAIKPLFYVWMKLAHVLGIINSTLILFIIFIALIVPFGFFLKLTKSLQLKKSLDPDAASYLIEHSDKEILDPKSMENPY